MPSGYNANTRAKTVADSAVGVCAGANLVFHNGLTIPLLSEFLSYGKGDPDDHKQDCEQKAFKRLAERLKEYFKRLPILLLLDGLYPTGR